MYKYFKKLFLHCDWFLRAHVNWAKRTCNILIRHIDSTVTQYLISWWQKTSIYFISDPCHDRLLMQPRSVHHLHWETERTTVTGTFEVTLRLRLVSDGMWYSVVFLLHVSWWVSVRTELTRMCGEWMPAQVSIQMMNYSPFTFDFCAGDPQEQTTDLFPGEPGGEVTKHTHTHTTCGSVFFSQLIVGFASTESYSRFLMMVALMCVCALLFVILFGLFQVLKNSSRSNSSETNRTVFLFKTCSVEFNKSINKYLCSYQVLLLAEGQYQTQCRWRQQISFITNNVLTSVLF